MNAALLLHRVLDCRRCRQLLMVPLIAALLASGTVFFVGQQATAAAPRVGAEGKLPSDVRLEPQKDLNGYFPFTPPENKHDWEVRAEQVRRRILVAEGLWPMPTKTPLNAVIHGKVDRDNYTVERVFFESLPGFYCTGSLYRPKGRAGEKLPGVLCPHGHWVDARFSDTGPEQVRRLIVQGAERFEEGGRNHYQARCVQLARMGCVVFQYDMIGASDSVQLGYQFAHKFAKQRPEANTPQDWGLFSPQAESHLQHIMGLQTLNSVRAIDFLHSLPDVDTSRLLVTGASGGGTQTMLLAAIDPRVTVSVPAVMVSTAMQGGCTCENCCLLRIGTGNVEFAALFAPKPQACIAADDWTREMPTKGFPELKEHYKRMGAEKNVELFAWTHFPHNYNYVNRSAMYQFVNKHFKLRLPDPVVEEDYRRLSVEEATVWTAEHPRPKDDPDFDRKICRWLTRDADAQLKALIPNDADGLQKYREVVGAAVDTLVARRLPDSADIEYERVTKTDEGSYLQIAGWVRNTAQGEELPVLFLYPKQWNGQAVIWLTSQGKSGLLTEKGVPRPEIQQLLDAGMSVAGVDLIYQGEFLADGKPLTQSPKVENPREFAGYTHGYNHPVVIERAHDVLTMISFVRNHETSPTQVFLVATDGTGAIAALARAQARDAVDAAAIDTAGFRFGDVSDIRDMNFLPGGANTLDLPGILALGAPGRLWVAGEGNKGPEAARHTYRAADAQKNLVGYDGPAEDKNRAIAAWLLSLKGEG